MHSAVSGIKIVAQNSRKFRKQLCFKSAISIRGCCCDYTLRAPFCKGSLTWSDSKVRELIAVKVLHTSLLNVTVVAFKVLPLGSYAPMPAPSPPFKTILELVLWNGIQSCRCINPDVINVIKMPSFQYFLYFREQKKSH